MLSDDMAQELKNQAHLYEKKLHKHSCLNIYKEILWVREIRNQTLMQLKSSIKKSRDAPVTQPMDEKLLEPSVKKDEDASAIQQPMVEQLLESSIKKAEDASPKLLMLKEREAIVGTSRSLSCECCLTSPSIKKAEDAFTKQLMLKEREASVSVGISRSLSWERCLTSPS